MSSDRGTIWTMRLRLFLELWNEPSPDCIQKGEYLLCSNQAKKSLRWAIKVWRKKTHPKLPLSSPPLPHLPPHSFAGLHDNAGSCLRPKPPDPDSTPTRPSAAIHRVTFIHLLRIAFPSWKDELMSWHNTEDSVSLVLISTLCLLLSVHFYYLDILVLL